MFQRFSLFLPLALLLLVAALTSFAPAGAAHTATKTITIAAISACMQSPSDKNCDGQDPVAIGCGADGTTLTTISLNGYGTLAVRYSPTCKSAWAHIVSSIGTTTLQATITRKDGLSFSGPFIQGTAQKSPLVYAPLQQVQACGYINGFSQCTTWV